MPRISKTIIGETYGNLFVVSFVETSAPQNKAYITKCVLCGLESQKLGGNIRRSEKSRSKGCACDGRYRHDRKTPPNSWRHPAYGTWEGMMARCYLKTHDAYHRYGGRGISVCEEWHDVETFYRWIDSTDWIQFKLQIDRVNNDGDYSPENCKISTAMENMSNRSTNRFLEINGEKITIAEAARKFRLNKTTIKERLNRGWTDIESIKKVGK